MIHTTGYPSQSPLRLFLMRATFALLTGTLASAQTFLHFEARHVHPIALTPDGSRLLAVNSTDARLSVFDVSAPGNPAPVLIAEIPVGTEPVTVRARTDDEIWVVNEVSDSISIISLAAGVVIETLRTPDEPADLLFAGGKAFVTCARSNLIRVLDAATRAELAAIPLQGLYPRALAVSPNGSRIYAAFMHSGNRTTVLTAEQAPPQPAPTNPNLPAAPDTALIVASNDPRIPYTVLDHDLVEINAASHSVVRYFTGVGTNLFDIAVHPSSGDLWVPNTEARNLVRFEPALRGHAVDNRLSRIVTSTMAVQTFDLNAGVNYSLLPNPTAQAIALAQPMGAVFSPGGSHLWVAAFGSDRIAKLDGTGAILARVDVRTPPGGGGENSSRRMRGPRNMVFNAAGSRLYVMNKLSNSISVVDPVAHAVLAEVPAGSYDPMPAMAKEGRGFLFDARLSGNGTLSCASCHIDADLDGIAWDLGDPGGEMMMVMGSNAAVHDPTPRPRTIHPMKGPLATQTLRGMQAGAPFHWRGDRPTLQSFNSTFDKLMGGSEIPGPDMDALVTYLLTLKHHPNPNRNLNNTLPSTFAGGNPSIGRTIFNDHIKSHCVTCHTGAAGSNNNLDDKRLTDSRDEVKTPPMRTVYQRIFLNRTSGAQSLSGYGLNRDGAMPANFLPTVHFYDLDMLEGSDFVNVSAFVLCFETGTAQSAAFSRTVTAANSTASAVIADIATLEGQANVFQNDLVVQGRIGGVMRSFFFERATLRYRSDKAGEPVLTRNQVLALLGGGDAITFSGTIPGQGARRGGDRNLDGVLDRDESHPWIELSQPLAPLVRVRWPEHPGGWALERALAPQGPWSTVLQPRSLGGGGFLLDHDPQGATAGFFRLRRTW
jgi:YVTN family beta-propeller protein